MAVDDLVVRAQIRDELSAPLKEIRSELADVRQEVDKVGDASSRTARKTRDLDTEFTKSSRSGAVLAKGAGVIKSALLGVGAAVGGLGIVSFFKTAIMQASDLSESVNAVKVSYGKAAAGILKLGKNSAKQFGLDKASFNGLAVQFSAFSQTIAGKGGDVSKTFGDLIGRATDFASVMNLEVNDAATLFQSGLAGETEPLRKFGIDLSAAAVQAYAYAKGIAKTGTDLTEAQKVQARYALLMEKTSKMQGDFKNTNDGLANGLRILKSRFMDGAGAIGDLFLPKLADLVSWINTDVVGAFKTASDKVKGFKDDLGGFDFSKVDTKKLGENIISGLGHALDQLGTLGDKLAKGLLKMLGKIDWIGIGIAAGPAVIGLLLGLATGLINGITDPHLWSGIIDHLPAILLAVLSIALLPAKIIGPLAKILGKIPFVGKILEWLVTTLNKAGGKIWPAIWKFIKTIGSRFAQGFGSIKLPGGAFIGKVLAFLGQLIPRALSWFLKLGQRFLRWAGQAAENIGTGLRNKLVGMGDFLVAPFRAGYRLIKPYITKILGWLGSLKTKASSIKTVLSALNPFGDTPTQRGHGNLSLGGTLAAHGAISGSLGGGYRVSNALVGGGGHGPGSGDHQAGRAVDVVGRNLPQYAREVRKRGGYAAIHGQGSGKHVHAVMGDTPTRRTGRIDGPGGSHVTIESGAVVIHAGNASAEEIGIMVEQALRRIQRDAEEMADA